MDKKKDEIIVSGESTPSLLISQALTAGADLEKLQGLLDLQFKWEANEARKEYMVAMALFKADPPAIIRDKINKQYTSSYSSLENFVNSVIPALGVHNLSHRWDLDQSEGIKVTCIMTHDKGHSESTSMSGPPDTSGKKNVIQQIKSTITYLKLATLEAITGLASEDGNLNDDGNGAGGDGGHGKLEKQDPSPEEFNGKFLEVSECTNKEKLDKWIAKNKPWIDDLSEDFKERLKAHCQQYYTLFKKEAEEAAE